MKLAILHNFVDCTAVTLAVFGARRTSEQALPSLCAERSLRFIANTQADRADARIPLGEKVAGQSEAVQPFW